MVKVGKALAARLAGKSATRRFAFLGLAGATLLSACAEPDTILPGKRENIRSALESGAAVSKAVLSDAGARPIRLAPVERNADWPQGFGTPATRTAHPALAETVSLVWSASIGAGDSRKQRIVATPVVVGAQILTLDAASTVTATNTDGQTMWSSDLGGNESSETTGGGLAVSGDTLFVALGRGVLIALDIANGTEKWRQNLEGPGVGRPTVIGDLVYVTSGDDTGWAIEKDSGLVIWQLGTSPDLTNVLGAPAPAVSDDLAIFGFGSGDVRAVFRRGGLQRWSASVVGERFGHAVSNVGDLTGAPVISGQSVFVGNQSGRLVSLDLKSGRRNWTANDGTMGQVWPAGDSVFVLSDLGELLRLNAASGQRIWSQPLPKYVKERARRRSEIFVHHGPVLAGGRLYVASNDGLLRVYDPVDGALIHSVDIPGGASTDPVVAGGVLYLVSSKGELHAFR